MTIRILLFLVLIVPACSRQETRQDPGRQAAIRGIWWSPEMFQSAAFEIRDSTIYYPDEFRECRYELADDTILIHQDDGSVLRSAIREVTKDTLILVTMGIESIYTRSETPTP